MIRGSFLVEINGLPQVYFLNKRNDKVATEIVCISTEIIRERKHEI